MAYGALNFNIPAGISALYGVDRIGISYQNFATILDAMQMNSNLISTHVGLYYGYVNVGNTLSGISCVDCNGGLGYSWWHVATRDAIWMNGNDIVIREYLACGTLSHGANPCGLLTVLGGDWIDNTRWNIAT